MAAALMATGPGDAAAGGHHHKQPADGTAPTSGICATGSGRYVEVDLDADSPSPRCWQVKPGQRLRVLDRTGQAVRVRWRPYDAVTLHPGQAVTFGQAFASYLQPGDHRGAATGGPYAHAGFEIFLPGHQRAPAPPPPAG